MSFFTPTSSGDQICVVSVVVSVHPCLCKMCQPYNPPSESRLSCCRCCPCWQLHQQPQLDSRETGEAKRKRWKNRNQILLEDG